MNENNKTEVALISAIQQIQFSASENLRLNLLNQIGYLIQHDFSTLIQILYTIDVSEEKLKQALINQKDSDSAGVIADMIIAREIKKWKSKQDTKHQPNNTIHDDEKW